MTTAYEIPTDGGPQKFSVTLNSVVYNMTLKWNDTLLGLPSPCWILDIADANNNPIINSVPLVTGVDLLEQYAYLEIGGGLVVQSDNNPTLVPDFDTLGSTGHLYFVVS
jgi:hypothetical protein